MIVRELDENHDIFTRNGKSAFLRDDAGQGVERVAQSITTRLWLYLGEYFLDTTDGTPWYQQILTKTIDANVASTVIKRRILTTYGVKKITEFNMDFNIRERALTIRFTCQTIYGDVSLERTFS